jgi:pyruvate decarboxylase
VRTLPAGTQDDAVVSELVSRLKTAKSPIIIFDGGAGRLSWEPYAQPLADALAVPHTVTTMGKGVIDESNPLYVGAYAGLGSWQRVQDTVKGSDLIIWIGNVPSDFNTGMFTEHVNPEVVVDLQRFFVQVSTTIQLLMRPLN